MKKIENETLWSGILGIIAVLAAVVELILSGIEALTVVAAVKDIASTLAVVMVLILAIKQTIHKEPKTFDEVFSVEMEKVTRKYAPLLQKQEDGKHRYFIASKLSAINDNTPGAYHKFFDLVKTTEVEISISKTVFVGAGGSGELFKATKGKIVSSIENKCHSYDIIEKCEISANGMKLIFDKPLVTATDASALADVMDCVLLTFVAEYKRT